MNRCNKKAPPTLPEGEGNQRTSHTLDGFRGAPPSPLGRLGGASCFISVVIPNYNGKHLLEANLPSVFTALKFAHINYEVIVVDDASVDDSVVFIQHHYPEIKLLVNESNKGFSPTINKGIFAAKLELILALNSDVKLSENYFTDQLKYFEAPDTFGVMGQIVDLNGSGVKDGAKHPHTSFKGIKTTYNYLPATNGGRRTDNWE